MKKYILFLFFPFVIASCSAQSDSQKAVIDYLETQNGVRTDLKIEFLTFNISDITVADSVTILQNQFETERAQKIEAAKKSVKHWQESIKEQKGKKNQLVAKAVIGNAEKRLADAEKKLKEAQKWQPDYLDRYVSHNTSDILAKKVESRFSFMSPRLQTRQEMSALLILSADGKQCNKMIKQ